MLSVLLLAAAMQGDIARQPSETDIAYMTACAGPNSGVSAHGCIGMMASQCMSSHEMGETTYGMGMCAMRELKYWDDRLNAAYGALMDRYSDWQSRADGLQAAQRAWIAYRDAECHQDSLVFEGGTAQGIVHAGCMNDMTAKRALELEMQMSEAD